MRATRWAAGAALALAASLAAIFGVTLSAAQDNPSVGAPLTSVPPAPLPAPDAATLDPSGLLLEPAPAPGPPVDPIKLEAFVDGLIGGYMRDDHINGAVVAVVRRDGPVLLKAYGADKADGRPVDIDRTLFRIASISKTFTWLSLLQLVEDGKVRLDAPANDYLPPAAKIASDGFSEPVLVRHLMSHTAGFEDAAVAGRLFRGDMRDAPSLAEELALNPPKRVRRPGAAAVYSNYGAALAGLIAQTVGGQEFQARIEARVFGPLGMQRTTFREPYMADPKLPAPISEALAKDISDGFSWRGGAYAPRPFEYVTPNAPAGGASTTAADMARYMRMFLNKGALDGQRIISPETIAKLEGAPLFTNAPGVNGLAYGFMQSQSRKGWRGYGHGGNTLWFASWMAIYPALDLGVFVVGNTEGASQKLQADVPSAIVDYLFPNAADYTAPPKADPAAAPALQRFAGAYLADRRSFTTVEKLFCVVQCILSVSAAPEGQLIISGGGGDSRLNPVDVLTVGARTIHRFRNVESGAMSAFIVDAGLPIRYVSANGVARATRIDWLQSPTTLSLTLNAALFAGLFAGISGLWRAFRRRREGSETRWFGVIMPLAGWSWVVVIGALGLMFATLASNTWLVFSAWPPPTLALVQYGGLLAVALSLAAAGLAAVGWRQADWSLMRRVRIVLTLLCFAAAPVVAAQWNIFTGAG